MEGKGGRERRRGAEGREREGKGKSSRVGGQGRKEGRGAEGREREGKEQPGQRAREGGRGGEGVWEITQCT